jgi:hypothetical protein
MVEEGEMKKKIVAGILVSIFLVFIFSTILRNNEPSIIAHERISSILVVKLKVNQIAHFEYKETMKIIDQSKIARLRKLLDRKKSQEIPLVLDILINYDNKYQITINYDDGSNQILTLSFDNDRDQDRLAFNRLSAIGSFIKDDNLYELSENDIRSFMIAIG